MDEEKFEEYLQNNYEDLLEDFVAEQCLEDKFNEYCSVMFQDSLCMEADAIYHSMKEGI